MMANYKLPNHYALAWRQLHTRKDSCGSVGNGFSTSYQAKNALPWMYGKMKVGEVIQIGWKPSGRFGHASLVTRIKYLSDFSKFRIHLMNPNSGGISRLSSFKKIHQIFSISK